jgi:predicted DNA-binding transcriptional regulator AlpA
MDQIHKRFTAEQVKVLLKGYCQGILDRPAIEEVLGISRPTFFLLLKEYRRNPDVFSLAYHSESLTRIPAWVEKEIEAQLMLEKGLIEDPSLPISGYNYSAIKDRLAKHDIKVALSTIIGRAKQLGCYQPHPRKKAHDREVVTTAIGALIQHDASHHRWSPYAGERWVLITSIDDFSRKLLYADFFEQESTWAHINAAEALMLAYGIPLRYYVDSLRVFRFVQGRDSVWRKHVLQTDEADPQWRQVMKTLGVDVSYALSAQAKGKVERPYRWLQDRIVRTCAIEKITTINNARAVLKEELDRYNNHQVHSTTGEVPSIRFEKARKEGKSLFRPFALPKPYTSTKDVFCLRETRTVNGYRKIALSNHDIPVPNVPLREEVEVHLIPDIQRGAVELRIWLANQMVQSVTYPLKEFPRVQF